MTDIYIYSGNCRFCKCGILTEIKDDSDNYLYTGDIVYAYTVTEDFGAVNLSGLTVIVADHFDNYVGQMPVFKKDIGEPFVMGIKTCNTDDTLKKYPSEVWRVRKVKSFKDVIKGEHWKDFGFNFK